MPEELGIALVVLSVIGYLLFVLVRALLKALSTLHGGANGILAEHAKRRFEKNKNKLARHVRIVLPNELARAERTVNSLEAEFHRRRTETVWTPLRPIWEKKPFLRQLFSPQSATWKEMNIAEIDSILCPDPVPWFEKESAITGQNCTYPLSAPGDNYLDFQELSASPLQVKEATFEVEHGTVRGKDVNRFFRQERERIEEYNERRLALISRYLDLNRQIGVWNLEERERWKAYVNASTAMTREELKSFRIDAQKYSSECNEQKKISALPYRAFCAGRESMSLQELIQSWAAWQCLARFLACGISTLTRISAF